jgi:hypothetical protein
MKWKKFFVQDAWLMSGLKNLLLVKREEENIAGFVTNG